MHSLPWVHRDPVYKARWVGGQNSLPAHTCAKKTQPGNKGVAYMACHKRVACVDISPASMFPWQCVTGRDTCSKEWGGGKVSRRNRTPRNSFPPSESIEAHEDFYSEFWVRRAENTYFFLSCGHIGAMSAKTAFSGRITGCRGAAQAQFQAPACS